MDIFNESPTQQEKFRLAANKLLNHCFVLKKKEDTRNDYLFIVQHRDMFSAYFDLLGYRIDINETQGVAGLVNLHGTGRFRLKKIESIILLILRLLYVEKRKELSLNEEVIVLSDEIQQKYSMLKLESKPSLDKTTLRDALKLFRRFNLVALIDRDVTLSDARILTYPSILFAVPNENINQIYEAINNKLESYTMGGESTDHEEIDAD
ncbi:MAG: DUF4194 domain-containing protein [Eubacteriales bacterium]|nr:DUF4194 domain-containing protein [Eubacteriales bacterium]